MTTRSALDAARAVADAVLLEGYVLYPYRASAQKNRVRWQFGVLAPPGAAHEPDTAQTECLVDPGADPTLDVTARFLQVRRRMSEVPWDEGVLREVHATVPLHDLDVEREFPFTIPGGTDRDSEGVARRRRPLYGVLAVRAHRIEGPYGTIKVQVRLANRTPWGGGPGRTREDMLQRALVSAHTLLAVKDGAFLSLLDPPEWAAPAAQSCENRHTWPVLAGEGRRDIMLSSPIILYDYPVVAPESPADLCDATEIDELLLLRTLTLTDEEKAEARATDARAASIIERADHLPPGLMDRLHGAVRYLRDATGGHGLTGGHPATGEHGLTGGHGLTGERTAAGAPAGPDDPPWWDPGRDRSVRPETDSVPVPGGRASRGTQVRLRPCGTRIGPGAVAGGRRADAQDMFLDGRMATVEAVFFDVDGGCHLAVTVNDDPAAEVHGRHGRYRYFAPDEVEYAGHCGEGAR